MIVRKILDISEPLIEMERAIYEKINRIRACNRLPPLTLEPLLVQQARNHSRNMASGTVPFGHFGFRARVKAVNINFRAAAENVAFNQGAADPARLAVIEWVNSDEHWENITGNYNLTGVGVIRQTPVKFYFTQLFILRR
jgi:uncharacterized protein YkwD